MRPLTPSQTVGPYLHIGLHWPDGPLAAGSDDPGAIRIDGQVTDGDARVVQDAMVETWQASPATDAGFRGFARAETDGQGRYSILTRKPEPFVWDGAVQAPHLDVSIFARGLLHRLVTRIYFADEGAANAVDPVLLAVAAERRQTLLAGVTAGGYSFDVRLQGRAETVFFAV